MMEICNALDFDGVSTFISFFVSSSDPACHKFYRPSLLKLLVNSNNILVNFKIQYEFEMLFFDNYNYNY